ncbi:MAG TPA: NYN domain-containing protein [Acidimicrobiales bacterium]|nr:NYN domain-containing protein [Acidimicrobiales bacterium]
MRVGPGRRGAAGERGLTPEGPAFDALVRPALEAAWLLARAGERATPGSAPRALRPVLGHARLTGAALQLLRRVVEDDDGFRAAVAAATTEDAVGRAGWLFLARPDGWEEELDELAAAEAETSEADRAAREERTAARRLRGAEEARRRAEDALADARAQAARAAAELADERRSRRAAEEEARSLADRLASAERERVDAVSRAADVEVPTARIDELEAALEEARRSAASALSADEVIEVLSQAAAAAWELADTLAEAVTSFRARLSSTVESGAVAAEQAPASLDPGRARRRPVPLPPGLRDDSVEAAERLVRHRGALLLVDGYNASLRYRPDLPLDELRRRFVDALDELEARTGVDVHVVFDGVGPEDGGPAASSRRGRTRVTFSPAGTEADDVILALVDALPVDRPVLVASDDRRVRDGVEQRGGNVLTTRQLLAVLRREPDR